MIPYVLSIHLPILQVLVPFVASLVNIFLHKPSLSIKFVRLSSILNLAGIILLGNLLTEQKIIFYRLGNFDSSIGIEYKIDSLNYVVLFFINFIFSFFLFFGNYLLKDLSKSLLEDNNSHLVYTIILIVQTGLVGACITADIFNLYVFIEIYSLSLYGLLALSKDRRALVGALNYLIFGSIAATFILIGIGLIFVNTGSLNMGQIKALSSPLFDNNSFRLGACFFIGGCFFKVALVPFHILIVKTYKFASPILVALISSCSNVVGFYILIRFLYNIMEPHFILDAMAPIFQFLGAIAIIVGAIIAISKKQIHEIFIFSSLSQVGYIIIALSFNSKESLMVGLIYIYSDAILKISLFIFAALSEKYLNSYNVKDIVAFKETYPNITNFMLMNILATAAFPPFISFFNKVNLIVIILENKAYLSFVAIIIGSVLALIYNYKLIIGLYSGNKIFNHSENNTLFKNISLISDLSKPDNTFYINYKLRLMFYFFSGLNISFIFLNSYIYELVKTLTDNL